MCDRGYAWMREIMHGCGRLWIDEGNYGYMREIMVKDVEDNRDKCGRFL